MIQGTPEGMQQDAAPHCPASFQSMVDAEPTQKRTSSMRTRPWVTSLRLTRAELAYIMAQSAVKKRANTMAAPRTELRPRGNEELYQAMRQISYATFLSSTV